MALTTTTLSGASNAADEFINVTSATSFAANQYVKCGEEQMQIFQTYLSGTVVPVRRGVNGTFPEDHPSGANVITGVASDFSGPNATVVSSYPLAGRRRRLLEYAASGALTLPVGAEDMVANLIGTSVLAMTVPVPTKDNDGCLLYISSNGVAAHTVTFTGGLSGAGTSYDVLTINASAPVTLGPFMAVNGLWQGCVAVPMAGTVSNITATVG
jgi:hypothetical protein